MPFPVPENRSPDGFVSRARVKPGSMVLRVDSRVAWTAAAHQGGCRSPTVAPPDLGDFAVLERPASLRADPGHASGFVVHGRLPVSEVSSLAGLSAMTKSPPFLPLRATPRPRLCHVIPGGANASCGYSIALRNSGAGSRQAVRSSSVAGGSVLVDPVPSIPFQQFIRFFRSPGAGGVIGKRTGRQGLPHVQGRLDQAPAGFHHVGSLEQRRVAGPAIQEQAFVPGVGGGPEIVFVLAIHPHRAEFHDRAGQLGDAKV